MFTLFIILKNGFVIIVVNFGDTVNAETVLTTLFHIY